MVNALMRLKRHEQLMIDEAMTVVNVPTRRELDTTHKRVHRLQQQLRTLQDTVENLAPMEAESASNPAPPAAPAAVAAAPQTSTSTARKKTVAKAARGKPKRRVQSKKRG
jgi:Tfp pilus assembly protein FimV